MGSHWYFDIVQVFLKDTDERACAYIAGLAPNRWGGTTDGEDLFDSLQTISADYGEFRIVLYHVNLHMIVFVLVFSESLRYISLMGKTFLTPFRIYLLFALKTWP